MAAAGAASGAAAGTPAPAPPLIPVSPSVPPTKRKRRLADLTSEEINEIVASRGKMSQALVGKKFGIEQTEVSAIQRLQRAKTARLIDEHEKKNPVKRCKDVELTVPIAYGTISFWLGKKADENHSHKWTVYVRGATNEDLGAIIKRVVFQLHPSFNNPTRVVEAAPFELTETGWGEFEIGITVVFHGDVAEKSIDMFHHLKLYPEDESGPQSTKKPVVVESYDEIVFSEPAEAFFNRVSTHPAVIVSGAAHGATGLPGGVGNDTTAEKTKGDTKDHALGQWFLKHVDSGDLAVLTTARQQVQGHILKLKRDLQALESEALRLKVSAAH